MKKNAPGQGRKPKPPEVHALNGNPGKRPVPNPIPVPLDRPAAPENYDEARVKLWDYFCDAIQGMGLQTSINAPCLELLVDSFYAYRQMQQELQSTEDFVLFTKAGMSLSAYFRARKALFAEVMQLLVQFGFTPVARAQLAGAGFGSGDEKENDDPLSAILRKRAERN